MPEISGVDVDLGVQQALSDLFQEVENTNNSTGRSSAKIRVVLVPAENKFYDSEEVFLYRSSLIEGSLDPDVEHAVSILAQELEGARSSSDRITTRMRIIIETDRLYEGIEIPELQSEFPTDREACERLGKTPLEIPGRGTICCPGENGCPNP